MAVLFAGKSNSYGMGKVIVRRIRVSFRAVYFFEVVVGVQKLLSMATVTLMKLP